MNKVKKLSAILLGGSMLLSIPALPVLAEGEIQTGPMHGGKTAIGIPYDLAQGSPYIPGVPNPNASGGSPYIPGVPNPDASGGSPYIPGVPNPDATDGKIHYVDFDDMDQKDRGIVRRVKVGEDFTIKLEENASAGYKWSYTVSPRKSLTVMGDYTSQDKASRNTIGAPSDRNITFRANRAGTYTIKFTYERSFDNSIAETKIYTIYVK